MEQRSFTREEVIANALHWGLDMREWEESRIQQIVNIVNEPIKFPESALARKFRENPDWFIDEMWFDVR